MSGHTPWKDIPRKYVRADEFLHIARFCAEEAGRQYNHPMKSGKQAALAVGWMIDAWLWAMDQARRKEPLTVAMIEEFGRRIEPEVNRDGFRTCDIWVGGRQGTPPSQVRMAMQHYVAKVIPDLAHDPDQAYKAFEEIHPFGDGNGRSGKIIFNYLKGTLLAPTWPYNFWGISNP